MVTLIKMLCFLTSAAFVLVKMHRILYKEMYYMVSQTSKESVPVLETTVYCLVQSFM